MKECIIFGTGSFGKKGYYKLCNDFHILAYSDNNPNTWGSTVNGKDVIKPDMIPQDDNVAVVICSTYFDEINRQLKEMGVHNIWFINPKNWLLQKCDIEKYEICDTRKKLKKVLFVQHTQCIRTYRSAKVLSEKGIIVDFAFLDKHPLLDGAFENLPYNKIVSINSINGFLDFINDSDYDIIHCSNEPDYLTALLVQCTDKKIIHDTHDMVSLKRECTMDELVNEYVANVRADGNLYVTEKYANIARNKFGVNQEKIMILPNLPIREFFIRGEEKTKKKSANDGSIHCVYEGTIAYKEKDSHRFLENIFLKLAENCVHVHIYIPMTISSLGEYLEGLEKMNPYIHFEGCLEHKKLITELTKYDVGLALFNVNEKNKLHLANASVTKFYDYLAAGLPIAVGDIDTHKQFVAEYGVGMSVDLQTDIVNQLKKISNINIPDNILEKNKMYLDLYANELIKFYEKIINQKDRNYNIIK